MNSSIGIKGRLDIVLTGADGVVKETRHIDNLVVTAGKQFIAARMKDGTADPMSHMAVGEGATAPAVGNTALGDEKGRVALSSTTVSGANVVYAATFGAGVGTGSLTEAGLFNAASAGDMLSRATFATLVKGGGDTIGVTWTISIT